MIPLYLLAAPLLLVPPLPALAPAPPEPPLRGPVGWYAPLAPTREPTLPIADPLALWAQPRLPGAAAPAWPLDARPPPGDRWVSIAWAPMTADPQPIPSPPPQGHPLRWADPLTPIDLPAGIAAVHEGPPQLPPLPSPNEYDVHCPPLPAGSGLRWRHQRGPDFDVCRAAPARGGADTPRLAMYVGNWPDFEPASRTVLARTRLRGRPVRWFRASGGGEFARETLFAAHGGRYGRVFHVWIVAKSEQELSDTLRLVSRLSFE